MSGPIQHLGHCVNPDCLKRVCCFFKAKEYSPADIADMQYYGPLVPAIRECAFCMCSEHEHVLLALSVHNTFFDLSQVNPNVKPTWGDRFQAANCCLEETSNESTLSTSRYDTPHPKRARRGDTAASSASTLMLSAKSSSQAAVDLTNVEKDE